MRALERLREALAAALPEVRVGYASSAVTELALAVAAGSSSRGAVQAGLPVSIHDLVEAAANRLCENGSKELALSQRFGARQK